MTGNQDLIIAIQSSGESLSVCLWNYHDSPILMFGDKSLRQSETLMPMLAELKIHDWNRVHFIAVSVGPGSFTGIRLGLAAAHGLGMARNIAVHGVSNFDLVRWITGKENVAVPYINDTFFMDNPARVADKSQLPKDFIIQEESIIRADNLARFAVQTSRFVSPKPLYIADAKVTVKCTK